MTGQSLQAWYFNICFWYSVAALTFGAKAFVIAMGVTLIAGEVYCLLVGYIDDNSVLEVLRKQLGYPASKIPGKADANIVW